MSPNNNDPKTLNNIYPSLEKMLIETYLKGKGYTQEELRGLPEEKARQLMTEASTYASCKLADVEGKVHLIQALHDAFLGE